MFYVNLDLGDLLGLSQLSETTRKSLQDAACGLAAQIHGRLVKLAGEKLHSRREMYVDNLKTFPLNKDVWVVQLNAEARWIEDGMPAHNMLDDLLKQKPGKKVHDAKDGSKYVIVPFDHSPGHGTTNATQAEMDLIKTIQAKFKAEGIPWGKLERDAGGQAKLGKLHSFNIMTDPIKTHNGPGQGKGPVGQVRQGPTGIPFLQGVRVYQSEIKDPKTGKKNVRKSIMTFRIASSKHYGQDRWNHPGLEPINLFEDVIEWAQSVWETEIAPGVTGIIMSKFDE